MVGQFAHSARYSARKLFEKGCAHAGTIDTGEWLIFKGHRLRAPLVYFKAELTDEAAFSYSVPGRLDAGCIVVLPIGHHRLAVYGNALKP
eukprot:4727440-Pyramimonas_sp.AAC.7